MECKAIHTSNKTRTSIVRHHWYKSVLHFLPQAPPRRLVRLVLEKYWVVEWGFRDGGSRIGAEDIFFLAKLAEFLFFRLWLAQPSSGRDLHGRMSGIVLQLARTCHHFSSLMVPRFALVPTSQENSHFNYKLMAIKVAKYKLKIRKKGRVPDMDILEFVSGCWTSGHVVK